MSAFKAPWSDIEETYPGQPYVVDSNGWGWFAIFMLLALPFFLIWLFLHRFANAVCEHPYVFAGIYLAISCIFGFILYWNKAKKHPFLGFLAVVLTLLPIAWVQGIYAIPYVLLKDGFFWVTIEWLLVTAAIVGATVFVMVISNTLGNGLMHLMIAMVFFVIIVLLVKPPNDLTTEAIKKMYGLI